MIGHVFASSGAVCLAVAPSLDRVEDYIVLARTENGYAVARVALRQMPSPTSWLHAAYYDKSGGTEADLFDAVEAFAEDTGLLQSESNLRERVRAAEQFAAETIARAHESLQGS